VKLEDFAGASHFFARVGSWPGWRCNCSYIRWRRI